MKLKAWLKFLGILPMFSVEGEGDGGSSDNTGSTDPGNVTSGDDSTVSPVTPTGDATPPPVKSWPDTWREDYAKDNEKRLNRLKRFTTPEAALDWAFEADRMLSSGKSLPDNPTPEQVSAWRKTMGIPESADGYTSHLKDLPIGDQDAELIKGYLANAFDLNLTPDQVKKNLTWFYGEREKAVKQYEEHQFSKDNEDKDKFTKQLRDEWGPAYTRNLAAIDGFLRNAPPLIEELIANGRLEDGTRIGNHPEVLNWIANMAMELNPVATVVPGAGADSMSQIDSEIATLEARMGGDQATRSAYFKDEVAQKRYRDLISAKETVKIRGSR